MPTETFKFKSCVVELICRYEFKDACRVRSVNGGPDEIVSFSELRPHRTREEYWKEKRELKEEGWQKFLREVLAAIGEGNHTVASIARRLGVSTKRVSKAVNAIERDGRIPNRDWSKRDNIHLPDPK